MDHDSDSSGHAKIQDLTLCPFGADQRPTPNEKKTGTRYRKITDCARRKKGERRKFFSEETSVPLDLPANGCLLMGDPFALEIRAIGGAY